jgi:hypothetical protein
VKWPKYFFLLITMKLASLVEIDMLIRKFLTGRSSFSAKRVEKFLSSYLFAIYPKNETLSLVDPVPTKSKDIGGKGVGDVHKMVCVWRVVVLGQSILT